MCYYIYIYIYTERQRKYIDTGTQRGLNNQYTDLGVCNHAHLVCTIFAQFSSCLFFHFLTLQKYGCSVYHICDFCSLGYLVHDRKGTSS